VARLLFLFSALFSPVGKKSAVVGSLFLLCAFSNFARALFRLSDATFPTFICFLLYRPLRRIPDQLQSHFLDLPHLPPLPPRNFSYVPSHNLMLANHRHRPCGPFLIPFQSFSPNPPNVFPFRDASLNMSFPTFSHPRSFTPSTCPPCNSSRIARTSSVGFP